MNSFQILKSVSKRRALFSLSVFLIILFMGGLLGCTNQMPSNVNAQSPSTLNSQTAMNKNPGNTFPIPTEIAWGNDQLWDMLFPHAPTPANDHSLEPLYMVAPNDPAHPQSEGHPALGIGPHDHVIPVPPLNKGSFSGTWDIVLVVDYAKYHAAGDKLVPPYTSELEEGLKSAEEVQNAVNSGKAFLYDIGFNLICPVRPHIN